MKKVISNLILALILVLCVVAVVASPNETDNSAPKADDVKNPVVKLVGYNHMLCLRTAIQDIAEPAPTSKPNSETIFTTDPEFVNLDFKDDMSVTYNKLGFGDKYGVYRFEGTDIVAFRLNDHSSGNWYLIGEDREKTEGPSTVKGHMVEQGQFLALSSKYMLFLTEEGKIAIDLEEKIERREDGIYIVNEEIPFDELSKKDQEAFVYPCSYEVITNLY